MSTEMARGRIENLLRIVCVIYSLYVTCFDVCCLLARSSRQQCGAGRHSFELREEFRQLQLCDARRFLQTDAVSSDRGS
jgi:hypothetical protein